MTRSDLTTGTSALFEHFPLPIATMYRRSLNAKSPKDRHDTAYFAWEASVRLAVAAAPPEEAGPLAHATFGRWVGAMTASDDRVADGALTSAYGLLTEVGQAKRQQPKAISARRLIDALPAYRNKVVGHGSVRSTDFYGDAAEVLLDALSAAWTSGFFLAAGGELLFVESLEIDSGGQRRARLYGLTGMAATILDPAGTTAIPDELLPRRVYLRSGTGFVSLYPWVLFDELDGQERLLFINGVKGKSVEYLDYATGALYKDKALRERFATLGDDVRAAFAGAPPEALESAEAPTGARLGEYTLLGKLGEGGMGVVHLARQEPLERLVALKVLPKAAAENATAAARFEREIRAVARCDDRNVVRILTSGREGESRYYAMEWVGGVDLEELAPALARASDFDTALQEAWTERRAALLEIVGDEVELAESAGQEKAQVSTHQRLAMLMRDAARGLGHMHEQKIVHRDIKPANLVLTVPDRRIVVMDLGLAAVGGESRALTRDLSALLGTLRYMAPEQFQRDLFDIDARADIYSLGATFYELVCGRPYRNGDTEARIIQQAIGEEPPPAYEVDASVPYALGAILEKATQRDPNKRYANAAELVRDVEAFLAEQPTVAERQVRSRAAAKGPAASKKRPLLLLAGALVVVAAVVVGVLLNGGGNKPDPSKGTSHDTNGSGNDSGNVDGNGGTGGDGKQAAGFAGVPIPVNAALLNKVKIGKDETVQMFDFVSSAGLTELGAEAADAIMAVAANSGWRPRDRTWLYPRLVRLGLGPADARDKRFLFDVARACGADWLLTGQIRRRTDNKLQLQVFVINVKDAAIKTQVSINIDWTDQYNAIREDAFRPALRVFARNDKEAIARLLGRLLIREAWSAPRWQALSAAALAGIGELRTSEQSGAQSFDVSKGLAAARGQLDKLAFAAVAGGTGFDAKTLQTVADAIENAWLGAGSSGSPRRMSDPLVARATALWAARGWADQNLAAVSLGCGTWFSAELTLESSEALEQPTNWVKSVVALKVTALDCASRTEFGSFLVKGETQSYPTDKRKSVRDAVDHALRNLPTELMTIAAMERK